MKSFNPENYKLWFIFANIYKMPWKELLLSDSQVVIPNRCIEVGRILQDLEFINIRWRGCVIEHLACTTDCPCNGLRPQ